MKVKIFNSYRHQDTGKMKYAKTTITTPKEIEDEINYFIKGKNVLDIKVTGLQCERGWEKFQYVVIYKEE